MAFFVAFPVMAFILAVIAGFLPIFIWLWLFRQRRQTHPEPKKLVALAFLSGIAAVVCVIPFEEAVYHTIGSVAIVIIGWAIIEEVAKYIAAELSVLRRADNDEPIDSMMYMIATALGFAALENVLFIVRPLLTGNIAEALATASVRFFGSSLIHVVSSSIVGYGLALSFGKSRVTKLFSLHFLVMHRKRLARCV